MLHLPADLHEAIRRHGMESYPFEGCGLLLGQAGNGANVVLDVRPLPNVWPDDGEKGVRFRIAEDDWRDVEIAAMEANLDVIGVFHSHPDHAPVASPRDLAWAAWPGYSYLITTIAGGTADLSRSWQLLPDRSGFVEELIEET
jgi:proteasome lid subunit RPN8/RPN11